MCSKVVRTFEFHPEHNHWHIGDVALFEVRKAGDDGTGGMWGKVFVKTTFCLIDWYKLDDNAPTTERAYWECATSFQYWKRTPIQRSTGAFIDMFFQPDNNNAPTGILVQYPGAGTTPAYVKKYGVTQDEGAPPKKMVRDILGSIEPIFPGCKAAYNGLAWYHFGLNDPWLQGGYSYWRVGQITGFSGYEGVPEGNIHFAGEHTSQDFQGYMEGALRSGERCALEI